MPKERCKHGRLPYKCGPCLVEILKKAPTRSRKVRDWPRRKKTK